MAAKEYAHFRLDAADHARLDQLTRYLTEVDPAGRAANRSDALRFAILIAAEKISKKVAKSS